MFCVAQLRVIFGQKLTENVHRALKMLQKYSGEEKFPFFFLNKIELCISRIQKHVIKMICPFMHILLPLYGIQIHFALTPSAS